MDEINGKNAVDDITAEASEWKEIAKEWLDARHREHWMLTVWVFFAVAAVIVLAYTALERETATFALVGAIPLPLILWCVIQYRDHRALRRLIEEYPALEQQEGHSETVARKRAFGFVWKVAVLVICGLLFGFLALLVVPFLFRESVKTDADGTFLTQIQQKNESRKSNFGCLLLLIFFAAGGAFLYYAMLCSAAMTRASAANTAARSVYNAVTTWQDEQDEQGKDIPLETTILYIDEKQTYDINTLQGGIWDYFRDTYWCAIVCDENGKILYTFYSGEEITEDELIPMEWEQQREIETNLFTRGEVVGWYAPQE